MLTPVLPTMSAEEIFEEVIVAPRRSFPVLAELRVRVIERPGWLQIVTPSITTGGLNEVAYSALADDEADAVIDATIAGYRELGLKFRWNVGPDSAPADLGERLARRGLVGSWGRGMARATGERPASDPAITITEVGDRSLAEFSRVMAEGWNLDAGPLAELNGLMLAAPGRRHRMFLAAHRGEPAGVASYVALPRSAHLIGGVVLPAFRGKGVYRALVAARLAHAHVHGLALATSHAREASSAPILERLGFATICRFPMYLG